MAKSLGDYNIEKSSSSDMKNIKWTQKNPADMDKLKSKKKTTRTTSPFNVIYTQETEKVQPPVKKVFKIGAIINIEKSKNKTKKADKRFHNSSLSNCKIEPGFKRPAR